MHRFFATFSNTTFIRYLRYRSRILLFPLLLLTCGTQVYGEEADDLLVIGLVDKGTNVFYLSADVGGDATELLLDTGSGYLALNSRLIRSLEARGMATYERSIRAKMASGSVSKVKIYRISSLDLGAGCVMHDVEAAMLGSSSRNILGMNVLKQVENVKLSIASSTLTLDGCGSPASPVVASVDNS